MELKFDLIWFINPVFGFPLILLAWLKKKKKKENQGCNKRTTPMSKAWSHSWVCCIFQATYEPPLSKTQLLKRSSTEPVHFDLLSSGP